MAEKKIKRNGTWKWIMEMHVPDTFLPVSVYK